MKNIKEISLLIDFYGKLLTVKQFSYLEQYYFKDFSLSEIAESNNVSKSAIFDSISKSVIELKQYEKKLSFISNFKKRMLLYRKIEDANLKEELIKTEVYESWKQKP